MMSVLRTSRSLCVRGGWRLFILAFVRQLRPNKVAIQEDVDVVGLSFLQGAHLTLAPVVARELKDAGAGDIPVIVGGIIPMKDIPKLKENGIKEVFLPGTRFDEIADFIYSVVDKK